MVYKTNEQKYFKGARKATPHPFNLRLTDDVTKGIFGIGVAHAANPILWRHLWVGGKTGVGRPPPPPHWSAINIEDINT